MAISVAWQTVVTFSSATTPAYTIPSGTGSTFGVYARDLVINNSGSVAVFANLNPATGNAANTTNSFYIPTGGTVILTQCQVPAGYGVSLIPASGTASASIGFATNVAYI